MSQHPRWNQLSEPLLEAGPKSQLTILKHFRRARTYAVFLIASLALVACRQGVTALLVRLRLLPVVREYLLKSDLGIALLGYGLAGIFSLLCTQQTFAWILSRRKLPWNLSEVQKRLMGVPDGAPAPRGWRGRADTEQTPSPHSDRPTNEECEAGGGLNPLPECSAG
eukprot:jgi/Botrbrau1/8987/Bobra.0148s0093.1